MKFFDKFKRRLFSIFMIFVILCMTILSVLSYTRASQNEKIAERERLFQEAIMKSEAAASERTGAG